MESAAMFVLVALPLVWPTCRRGVDSREVPRGRGRHGERASMFFTEPLTAMFVLMASPLLRPTCRRGVDSRGPSWLR